MFKTLAKLEHVIGDKSYHLLCDGNSSLAEVKEALFVFMKVVGQVEDAAKAAQAQQQAPAPEQAPAPQEAVQPQAEQDAS